MLECLKVASVIITGEPGLAGNWGQSGGPPSATFLSWGPTGTHVPPLPTLELRGPSKSEVHGRRSDKRETDEGP